MCAVKIKSKVYMPTINHLRVCSTIAEAASTDKMIYHQSKHISLTKSNPQHHFDDDSKLQYIIVMPNHACLPSSVII